MLAKEDYLKALLEDSKNDELPKHKVFVSFHSDDEAYRDLLIQWNNGEKHNLFADYSVGSGDISDDLEDETIRRKIRAEYIQHASVLVLLCGEHTKERKFVDWELQAAMSDPDNKMGILVINLPTIKQWEFSGTKEDRELLEVVPRNWQTISDRATFEEKYPFLPSRIIDCLANKDSQICIVNWSLIQSDHDLLVKLIDSAFNRREEMKYDYSAPLRRRNS